MDSPDYTTEHQKGKHLTYEDYNLLGHGLQTPFRMVCGNFILPEFCKPCLFLCLFLFAQFIVPYLLLLNKIHAKQKEQHPTRCCYWCDREDSNLWPSGSENYDTARNLMIYSNFLLVLHSSATSIDSDVKRCVNDKN